MNIIDFPVLDMRRENRQDSALYTFAAGLARDHAQRVTRPKRLKLAEIDEKIINAGRAARKANDLITALRIERELVEKDL